ncbi:META domain-containing protein [Agromyces sp. G08B096]|uniref:META domain-containing protein n=1 Tax=Agromyces sp. G08B096 TaxID=3156399 RepID=A0AAU7W873_9MICO
MRGIQSIIIGTAAAAVLALAGCAGSPSGGAGPASTPTTSAADVVGTWGDAADSSAPSLSLTEDGGLTGTDGCNRLTGTWELDDDGIEFGDLASTRMFCEGVDTWLSAADRATIEGDVMTVFGDDDTELGTLERTSDTPATEPAGGASDGGASGAAAAFIGTWGTADATQPHLVIAADGRVTGSDGCNSMGGRWELDDDGTLEFDEMVMTLMACPGGDQTLNRLDSATVDGDTLTVLDDHGAVLATLPRTA